MSYAMSFGKIGMKFSDIGSMFPNHNTSSSKLVLRSVIRVWTGMALRSNFAGD